MSLTSDASAATTAAPNGEFDDDTLLLGAERPKLRRLNRRTRPSFFLVSGEKSARARVLFGHAARVGEEKREGLANWICALARPILSSPFFHPFTWLSSGQAPPFHRPPHV
ncbi:hypothetical protein MRX96_015243 [Rhipicephalus microplus]